MHRMLLPIWLNGPTRFLPACHPAARRIYDSEKGLSCHQCRQKTMGQRTSCSSCKSGLVGAGGHIPGTCCAEANRE